MPLSAAGAANMLYLVACLNETLQHNNEQVHAEK
jgi:hypothetical protein